MRPTTAIGSAEAKRRRLPAERTRRLSPQTFAVDRVVAVPDRFERGVSPQVIDMPIRASRQPAVMAQAARDPAGTESAADIERPTRRQRQQLSPADADRSLNVELQQQRIGAWPAVDFPGVIHRSAPAFPLASRRFTAVRLFHSSQARSPGLPTD